MTTVEFESKTHFSSDVMLVPGWFIRRNSDKTGVSDNISG